MPAERKLLSKIYNYIITVYTVVRYFRYVVKCKLLILGDRENVYRTCSVLERWKSDGSGFTCKVSCKFSHNYMVYSPPAEF